MADLNVILSHQLCRTIWLALVHSWCVYLSVYLFVCVLGGGEEEKGAN